MPRPRQCLLAGARLPVRRRDAPKLDVFIGALLPRGPVTRLHDKLAQEAAKRRAERHQHAHDRQRVVEDHAVEEVPRLLEFAVREVRPVELALQPRLLLRQSPGPHDDRRVRARRHGLREEPEVGDLVESR